MLTRLTEPSDANDILTVDEALRAVHATGVEEAELMRDLIRTARYLIENYCCRSTAETTYVHSQEAWTTKISLLSAVGSIDSVQYWDGTAYVTVDEENYYFEPRPNQPSALYFTWANPPTLGEDHGSLIIVEFTAGKPKAQIDPRVRFVTRALVTHWWVNKAPIAIGNIVNTLPVHLQTMLWNIRIFNPARS